MGMRLVIKERKIKEQIDLSAQNNYVADISPLDFLLPVTPKGDYKFYKLFLNKLKEIKPNERTIEKVKEIFNSLNPDLEGNVAANIVGRAISNLLESPFNKELAGRSSLTIQFHGFPYVIGHEGRARAFMSIIDSYLKNKPIQKINVLLIFIGRSWEQKESTDQIVGQRLGGEKGDSLFINKIHNIKKI